MLEMNALEPTDEQMQKFMSQFKADEPVYMLNLLKFKDKATYKDGEDISGRAAYKRYIDGFNAINKDVCTIRFAGDANGSLIGNMDHIWDAVLIVEYPNRAAMMKAVSSEDYKRIYKHRMAGLEGQLLIHCGPTNLLDT